MIQTVETRLHLRVEYFVEGGDSKALQLYAKGATRELTYEAMDEVLEADISEPDAARINLFLYERNTQINDLRGVTIVASSLRI